MKKILLLITAFLFLNTVYADPVPPRLMRNLRGYPVMKASLQKKVLKLVTTQHVVNEEVYKNVVMNGACSVLWNNPEKGWLKARIDRIDVLSRDEKQGYAFTDARQSCLELIKIKEDSKRKQFISKHTSICEDGFCHDLQTMNK